MVKIETVYSTVFMLMLILSIPIMFLHIIMSVFGIYIHIFVLFIGSTIMFVFFVYGPFILITQYSGKKYMDKYPKSPNFKENQNHHALLLLISQNTDDSLPCGLSVLIKGLLKKNCNFKIYYCNNCNDVKKVLKNQYATDIWIFGHGWRGGLGFKNKRTLKERIYRVNKGELLEYDGLNESIDEYPKKRFIAQLHCNNKKSKKCNVPLPEILLIDPSDHRNSFVSSFILDPMSIYLTLKFKLQKRIKSEY